MARENLPYLGFYIGDWKKDPGIQCLSITARGLCLEMLFLMHESPQRGHLLTPSEKPFNENALSLALRVPLRLLKKTLCEIESQKIFSQRESDGAIYSRRMVRDQTLSDTRRIVGKKGGVRTSSLYFGMANTEANNTATTEDAVENNLNISSEGVQGEIGKTPPNLEKIPSHPLEVNQDRPQNKDEKVTNSSEKTVENRGAPLHGTDRVIVALSEFGIDHGTIQKLVAENELDYLQKKLAFVKMQQSHGKVKNLAAFTIAAIQKNFLHPQEHQKELKDEKKRHLEKIRHAKQLEIISALDRGEFISDFDHQNLPEEIKAQVTYDEDYYRQRQIWRFSRIKPANNDKAIEIQHA